MVKGGNIINIAISAIAATLFGVFTFKGDFVEGGILSIIFFLVVLSILSPYGGNLDE